MSVGYGSVALAYKGQFTDALSFGLFFDQPYGANLDYPAGTGYYAQGATAELSSNALTAVLKYRFPNNISVYGGVRYQTLQAEANLPYVGLGYTVDGEQNDAWGYLVGAAYERPDIALRIGLTYLSEITHELDTQEDYIGFVAPGIIAAGQLASTTEITTPRQFVLDFQTGVAANTLVFGDIRWVEWTEFEIAPKAYTTVLLNPLDFENFEPLVEYEDDRWVFNIGVGQQLNENWAIAGTLTHEPSTGSIAGNLGPTDGFTSAGLGVTFTQDNVRITAAARYIWLGDAETPQGSQFEDNTAIAGGIQIGFTF
jgi:long-subunit fatty acid transport protein